LPVEKAQENRIKKERFIFSARWGKERKEKKRTYQANPASAKKRVIWSNLKKVEEVIPIPGFTERKRGRERKKKSPFRNGSEKKKTDRA